MLARDWVIMIILFGLVAGIGYMIVADVASSDRGYDVENMTDSSFQDNYDRVSEISTTVYQMQNETTSEKGQGAVSAFYSGLKATFSVIGLLFSTPEIAREVLVEISATYLDSRLANLVAGAIITIIIVILVFVVISSVSRGKL